MDYPNLFQVIQGIEHLSRHSRQQLSVESLESRGFYVSVEIFIEEFKHDYKVVSERKVIKHLYDAELVRVVAEDLLE